MGLQNFLWYYHAAQLIQLLIIFSKLAHPDWAQIARPLFIHQISFSGAHPNLDLQSWPQRFLKPLFCETPSKLTHIWSPNDNPYLTFFTTPFFPPGMDIKPFIRWLNKVKYRIEHFINPTGPLTPTYCVSKLDMASWEQYRLRQISNFLYKWWSSEPDPLTLNNYELWCGQATEQMGGGDIRSIGHWLRQI